MPGIRPLLKLSYAVNHTFGSGPFGFHAVNVAIHAGCALLVYALLLRIARTDPALAGRERLAAAAGSLLFALHPVQTEAVTYASGRSTSLSALFALASIAVWLDGRARGTRWRTHLISPALFAAALAVKETAIVLPLALALAAAACGLPWRRLGLLPHAAVALAAAVAALASPTYRHLASVSLATRSVSSNLATQAGGVVYLAGQLVRVDRLNADPALGVAVSWTPAAVVQGLAIAATIAFGLAALRRRPAIAFGVVWFFLWLAPTNSLIPRLDAVNDRQLYVASIGPAWLLAWGACRTTLRPRTIAAGLVAAALLLGTLTWRRNEVYRDEIAFWEDVARKAHHNGRAFNNLGYAYALASRDAEAEAAFTYALALDPADVRAAVNLRLLREGALKGAERHP